MFHPHFPYCIFKVENSAKYPSAPPPIKVSKMFLSKFSDEMTLPAFMEPNQATPAHSRLISFSVAPQPSLLAPFSRAKNRSPLSQYHLIHNRKETFRRAHDQSFDACSPNLPTTPS